MNTIRGIRNFLADVIDAIADGIETLAYRFLVHQPRQDDHNAQ